MLEELEIQVLVVLAFIVVSALIGLCSVLRSIWRMRNEQTFLKNERDHVSEKAIAGTKDLRQWCGDSPEKLTEEQKKHRKYHLTKRVDTMLQSLENDPNKAKELPELHDLHDLTLQDELGHTSSAALQTVISFLLILGILGTLTGVHSVVDSDPGNDLTRAMAAALLPSMIAVGSTVVLMLLRGLYSAKVDAYLETLDFFTMTVLIPCLQPASNTQRNKKGLNKAIETFSENAQKIQEASDSLKKHTSELKEGIKNFQQEMNEIDKLLEQEEKIMQQFPDAEGWDVAETNSRLHTMEDKMKKMKDSNQTMGKDIEKLRKTGMEARDAYTQLTSAMEMTGKRLKDSMDMVEQMVADSGKLKNYSETIRAYDERFSSLFEKKETIERIYQAVDFDVEQVRNNDALVYDISQNIYDVAVSMVETKQNLEKFDKEEYDIEGEKHTVSSLLDTVQKGLQEFHRSQKNLMDVFEKRAKKMGIE